MLSWKWATVFAAMLVVGATGCETGGRLEVNAKPPLAKAELGPSVNEMVGAGTFAKNQKYQVFYVVGQSSPNQANATSDEHQDQGGLVGAAHSD